MKFTSILTCVICCFFFSSTHAQESLEKTNPEKLKLEDRFLIGFGVGPDHSILGFKLTFKITEKFRAHTGLGGGQFDGALPVLGLEYRFNKIRKDKITPFAFLTTGKYNSVSLNSINFDVNTPINLNEVIFEDDVFNAMNVGLGINYQNPKYKKFSVFFGVSYRVTDNNGIKEFYDDFNQRTGSEKQFESGNKFEPTFGVSYHL